ncbi:MAG: spoIIM [Clostridiales bacterium]|nr:spoIIM [Clostridiales bacterium]
MLKKLNEVLSRNIKENIGTYFTVTLFFAIGISVGAFTVKALDVNQKQELVTYLNKFFQILNNQTINKNAIFYQSIKSNFQTIFFIWLLGVTVIGIPFILVITSFRGFIVGFTITFLIQGIGWKGFILTLAAVLPQNIIFIPCLLIISATSLCFSIQAFRIKVRKKIVVSIRSNIFSYTTTILIMFGVMILGSLIEAYLSPYILQSLSSYMTIQ